MVGRVEREGMPEACRLNRGFSVVEGCSNEGDTGRVEKRRHA